MNQRIGFVMDPIGSIQIKKDSTFAMMLAAQRRGWSLWYLEIGDLVLRDGEARGWMRPVEVCDDPLNWYRLGDPVQRPLAWLDVLMMRKDPPFDIEYVYATYVLDWAKQAGCLVVNDPQSLRDANEKVFIHAFPHCAPPTLITRQAQDIYRFQAEHGAIVIKPLHGMGGASVFRLLPGDPNLNVVIETLTDRGRAFCMVQRFIPEIEQGDKRILLVDGEPVPYCLARIPAPGETRGNLAAGARGEARPLSARDRWIAEQVGLKLRARGVLFAGLDVIGDFLTEINITSPTCIRELDAACGLDIAGDLLERIAVRLQGGGVVSRP
ncbi:glutathione synthase [Caldichromatium japonicum]|uniref:Glutathione synthetase n=1 Tax=Caldichromatium japonicum TaxID=2699430 RepID=A0A6G7VGV7_9GAMM|nr:glutathione synthase [Caldichromatium japonicum]QIK39251.1 glutathione synthase [Caldichromatium japonicum]